MQRYEYFSFVKTFKLLFFFYKKFILTNNSIFFQRNDYLKYIMTTIHPLPAQKRRFTN